MVFGVGALGVSRASLGFALTLLLPSMTETQPHPGCHLACMSAVCVKRQHRARHVARPTLELGRPNLPLSPFFRMAPSFTGISQSARRLCIVAQYPRLELAIQTMRRPAARRRSHHLRACHIWSLRGVRCGGGSGCPTLAWAWTTRILLYVLPTVAGRMLTSAPFRCCLWLCLDANCSWCSPQRWLHRPRS